MNKIDPKLVKQKNEEMAQCVENSHRYREQLNLKIAKVGASKVSNEQALVLVIADNDRMRAALEFYADSKNWERIEGHTKWASNLKVQDCALLNCGGGRARLALGNK